MRTCASGVVAILVALALFLSAAPIAADEVAVPVALQVELLVKVVGYDRNMASRAGDKVRVFILTRAGNHESTRVASQADKAFGGQDAIVGLPHERALVPFTDARALAKACRARHASIVYVTPGFSEAEITAIAAALDGVDVFTASSVASFVPSGIVLGFDLVSGKPKLLVHRGQARKQNVNLSAEVLKLMKIYE